MNVFSSPSRFEPVFGTSFVGRALGACGLALWLVTGAAQAQAPVDTPSTSEMDDSGWTGRLQSPAIARKEAGAALVQGRRECARERQRAVRESCLKTVLADYDQMMRRVARRTATRSN